MSILFDFEFTTLIAMGVIAVVFHLLWGYLSMRLNPLFLLAAVFLLVSPLSIAGTWFVGGWKIARIYTTVMLVIVGLYMARQHGIGVASRAFLIFAGFYTLGALWSTYPTKGLLYKGLFFMIALAGVMLGNSVHTFKDLRNAMRILVPIAVTWGIIIWQVGWDASRDRRLEVYGMNANSVAASSAFNAIVCLYLLLYDNSKAWRIICYITGVAMACIIPLTGSRGGLGTMVLAATLLFLPVVKNPARFFGLGVVVGITAYVSSYFLGGSASERLTSTEFTRAGVWEFALGYVRESPIIGKGWVYHYMVRGEATTENLHSIYLNILAETGLVGITVMVICFGVIAVQARKAYRWSSAAGFTPAFFLAAGLLIANLAGGIFEIGPLVGSTINGLFFGMSIALMDRIPEMAWNHQNELYAASGVPDQPEAETAQYGAEEIVIPPYSYSTDERW